MDSTGDPVRTETVIVGAGQAGLAVGCELARRGQSSVILDAHERIGDSWRTRWDSLRLFTPARYDGLPGWRFPASGWTYPTKDEVADYLEAYAARFGLDVRTGVRVQQVSRDDDRFVVSAPDRRYVADQVVVATGGYQAPRIPPFASALTQGTDQLHSSDYRNPSQLRPGPVLVVGAGNSGAEIAVEVSSGHRTWLSGRDTGQEPVRPGSWSDRLVTPPFWFVLSHVLTVGNPLGRKVRRDLSRRGLPLARVRRADLAAAGVERVPRVASVESGLPVLDGGRVLDPATVIWCTGYTADYAWIDLPVLDVEGQPRHERGLVESAPGLYFMGLFFQHAGTSSLVGGAGRDAAHVAAHIVGRRRTERAGGQRGGRRVH